MLIIFTLQSLEEKNLADGVSFFVSYISGWDELTEVYISSDFLTQVKAILKVQV